MYRQIFNMVEISIKLKTKVSYFNLTWRKAWQARATSCRGIQNMTTLDSKSFLFNGILLYNK